MKVKNINIGLEILSRINDLGITKTEFAKRIGIAQQSVNRILDRESIDTDKLVKISEALDYNFFQEYVATDDTIAEGVSDKIHTTTQNPKATFSSTSTPLSDSDKEFYQNLVNFLQGQLKDKDKEIQKLKEENNDLRREKGANVG